MKFFHIWIFILLTSKIYGQDNRQWIEKLDSYNIKLKASIQFWSAYSHGTEVYDEISSNYQDVDDRINHYIRRSTLGLVGEPYRGVKFNFTFAFHQIGRDVLGATQGGFNNAGFPGPGLWNGYVQWKVKPKSQAYHLTVGYFLPQIGRESINGAFRVSSMEKSWSQNYLRRQLVGIGTGRSAGVNLGGIQKVESDFHIGYDVGIFNPHFQTSNRASIGTLASSLWVSRIAFYLGDLESDNYTISHRINYFGKRNGMTLALTGAYQGHSDIFDQNGALGFDYLINYKNWIMDGEWLYLYRKGNVTDDFLVSSATGYTRISHLFTLSNGKILEPTFMFTFFLGETEKDKITQAQSVDAFAGEDFLYDLGLNYYLSPDLKVQLHYTYNTANQGNSDSVPDYNNYFFQRGVGQIRRGNWVGLGFVASF